MLDPAVCDRCWLDFKLGNGLGEIDPRYGWGCRIANSVHRDMDPPKGCYRVFEQAVSTAIKKS